jgi:hypothetical protein
LTSASAGVCSITEGQCEEPGFSRWLLLSDAAGYNAVLQDFAVKISGCKKLRGREKQSSTKTIMP